MTLCSKHRLVVNVRLLTALSQSSVDRPGKTHRHSYSRCRQVKKAHFRERRVTPARQRFPKRYQLWSFGQSSRHGLPLIRHQSHLETFLHVGFYIPFKPTVMTDHSRCAKCGSPVATVQYTTRRLPYQIHTRVNLSWVRSSLPEPAPRPLPRAESQTETNLQSTAYTCVLDKLQNQGNMHATVKAHYVFFWGGSLEEVCTQQYSSSGNIFTKN